VENVQSTGRARKFSRQMVRWGLYPASWLIVLGAFAILETGAEPRQVWAVCVGVLAVTYLMVEFLFPYEKRWSMTLRSFFADVKYAALNSMFVAGLSAVLAVFTISIAGRSDGVASDWPLPLQLLICLLIFEACNYSIHRVMHQGKGAVGTFLWRMHAAHHLPPRLYLVMHAVFHPLNGILVQAFAIVLPIWVMGYSEKAVVMFLIINGMHGLISHFNVDVRMGWANYIFVGPELHRYHHSANATEAKNYGATLSVYDQLFGTFVYHPGTPPKELGVDARLGLPAYETILPVMALPFWQRKKVNGRRRRAHT